MSSHQNSAFHGESALELAQPRLPRYQTGVRAARPQVRSSPRISRAPDEIWGHYNNYRGNGIVISAIIHVVLLGAILSGAFIGHEVVQKVASRQNVILIAPSQESYALPTSKKVISGGGGGGDHDRLPAPKGRLPKTAMQQITPPAIIVRNEKPKLAEQPTVVVPPQVHLAENHMPNACCTTIERDGFRRWYRFGFRRGRWRRTRTWCRRRERRRHRRWRLQGRRRYFRAPSDFFA